MQDKKNAAQLRQRVLLEVACMQHVEEHPNAVRLIEAYEDARSFHIVMDYCSGGELFDHIIKGKVGPTACPFLNLSDTQLARTSVDSTAASSV